MTPLIPTLSNEETLELTAAYFGLILKEVVAKTSPGLLGLITIKVATAFADALAEKEAEIMQSMNWRFRNLRAQVFGLDKVDVRAHELPASQLESFFDAADAEFGVKLNRGLTNREYWAMTEDIEAQLKAKEPT